MTLHPFENTTHKWRPAWNVTVWPKTKIVEINEVLYRNGIDTEWPNDQTFTVPDDFAEQLASELVFVNWTCYQKSDAEKLLQDLLATRLVHQTFIIRLSVDQIPYEISHKINLERPELKHHDHFMAVGERYYGVKPIAYGARELVFAFDTEEEATMFKLSHC